MRETSAIVTFSHIRWNFVYGRPQQILSRLAAADHRVIFIEDPIFENCESPYWEKQEPEFNVQVYRPHLCVDIQLSEPRQIDTLKAMLDELLREQQISSFVSLVLHPKSLLLAESIPSSAVVYDHCEKLPQLEDEALTHISREAVLLKWADLVLTSSMASHEAISPYHENVHYIPNSVDITLFKQACGNEKGFPVSEPEDVHQIPRPRFGFLGVVDNRVDFELIDIVAAARPEWHFVFLGPIIDVSDNKLPTRSNIHFLGKKEYHQLPSYLSSFDVCLMPYKTNAGTISAAKALEYIAAEKITVATPVADAALLYGDVLLVADSPELFIEKCEQALTLTVEKKKALIQRMQEVAAASSWNSIAQSVELLIEDALQRRQSNSSQHEAA